MSGKNKGNYNDWQGKRLDQVEYSEMVGGLSICAIIVMMVIGYIMSLIC